MSTETKEMVTENSGHAIPKFDPPQLFSPNIYIPELNEKKCFGPRGYMDRMEYIIDKSTLQVAETAHKYHFSIGWKRKLEIKVLEAKDIIPLSCCGSSIICKATVGTQIQRTDLVSVPPRNSNVTWDQSLKFTVEEPCNIKLVVYIKKCLIPNNVLGHITISPNHLVEKSTVTNWFPFDTKGEIKLGISLSSPEMVPFKFSMATPLSLSFRDCHVLNTKGEKVFTVMGTWPNTISVLDTNDLSIMTVKNKIFDEQEKIFKVFMHGQTTSSLTITWFSLQGTNRIYFEGLASVSQIEYYKQSFTFHRDDVCVAYARHCDKKYNIEVRPGKDSLLLLAAVIVIAKLLEKP